MAAADDKAADDEATPPQPDSTKSIGKYQTDDQPRLGHQIADTRSLIGH